jgi:hypothetical protein
LKWVHAGGPPKTDDELAVCVTPAGIQSKISRGDIWFWTPALIGQRDKTIRHPTPLIGWEGVDEMFSTSLVFN